MPGTVHQHDSNPLRTPLARSGAFKSSYKDLTPVIGREYVDFPLALVLAAENRDDVIRDIAITVSERGVVFFRSQDITPTQMKAFISLLSTIAGCPSSSTLHTHPLTETASELGDQVAVISSAKQRKGGGLTQQRSDASRLASAGWHSDISFEPVPSDYAMLKIHTLPETGGDTLWASGYEIFERLSVPMRDFLEKCTARHEAKFFIEEASRLGIELRKEVRGSPHNKGDELQAIHPVVRTNPVTGWKSVYVNKGFTKRINEVTKDESDVLLSYLFNLVTQNHDAQVRFKWNKNDVALWDNRSTFHCATFDYEADRAGDRVCSLGERPFWAADSKSRREALSEQ